MIRRFFSRVRKPRLPQQQQEPVLHSHELRGFSEEQLRFLVESLPQIAWTGLPNGYIDYMNSRWFSYTGLTPQETYEDLRSAVHPDDLARYRESWSEAVRTQQPYEVEYRFRRASDGAYRWHLGRGLPVRDFEGNVIKWFGTCTDIHTQKEAQEEVQRYNEQLETIVGVRTAHLQQEIIERRKTERKYFEHLQLLERMINTLPMAAVAVNSQGKIVHANDSFRSLFASQTPMAVLLQRQCLDVLREAEHKFSPAELAHFLHMLHQKAVVSQEMTLEGGRTFSFEHLPTTGEAGGYILLMRDITQEKRMDAVKMEFMSLASHQLRTPLTSIRWALGRLRKTLRGRATPAEESILARLHDSAADMAYTIRTMLSISRVEAGLQLVSASHIDLCEFAESLKRAFAESCADKNITFTMACTPELSFSTDPLVLREIVENLLSNAVKYTPKGGSILLNVELKEGRVEITVRDSGVGIPAHQHDKVFSKFFRAENIVKIDTQGTGLGLYLVSRLIVALKGMIRFTSKEGEGTEFTIILPA